MDHPITLGISVIGQETVSKGVSEGVHKIKPCSGRLLAGCAPGIERGQWFGPPLALSDYIALTWEDFGWCVVHDFIEATLEHS